MLHKGEKESIVAVSLTQMDPFIESRASQRSFICLHDLYDCPVCPHPHLILESLIQGTVRDPGVLSVGVGVGVDQSMSCSSQVTPQWGSFLVIFNGGAIYPFSGNKGIFSCHNWMQVLLTSTK